MKKLIIISPKNLEYVQRLARQISDPRSKKGDFSKALNKIIEEHGK